MRGPTKAQLEARIKELEAEVERLSYKPQISGAVPSTVVKPPRKVIQVNTEAELGLQP